MYRFTSQTIISLLRALNQISWLLFMIDVSPRVEKLEASAQNDFSVKTNVNGRSIVRYHIYILKKRETIDKSPERLLLLRVIMKSSVALKKDCRSDPLKKLLDRSKIQEQVSEPRCLLRSTNLVTLNIERGSLRIEYLNDIRRTPSVLRELYLMRAIFFAKYTNYEREEGERTSQTMRRIPCREATKDPNFCNTKTTAHCLGEYYAPGQGTTRVCC
ncbi:hypothetical protein Bca4012_094359 [Brassica carinata]